jgi:hypothetical protein
LRIRPGKHREVQVARTGERKLFKGKVRKLFLEYFAATANAKWSAERAGVAYQTVWKHRMKDPGFAEDYDRALEQALARVRAKLVETKIRQSPAEIDGDWEVPELEEIDPRVGLQILREHGWGLSGRNPLGRPKKAGRAPRAASNAQVRSELEKRLVAYARRMRAEGREPPAWLPPADSGKGRKGQEGQS